MKKVVVVPTQNPLYRWITFETKKDYLTVLNKASGELIITDVKAGSVEPNLKSECVAVFKEWIFWVDSTYEKDET